MKLPLLASILVTLTACGGGPTVDVFEGGNVRLHRVTYGTWSAFVLEGAGGNVLFDAGSKADADHLLRGLDEAGFPPPSIDGVLISHGHFDHAGGVFAVKAAGNAQVLVHEGDEVRLESGDSGPAPPVTFEGEVLKPFLDPVYPAVEADVVLNDEVTLHSFGVDARVVPVPGHTPGSVAVVLQSGDALVGDMFRTEEGRALTHLISEDLQADRAHARALLDEGIERFHVAHGPDVEAPAVEAWLSDDDG